MTIDRFRMALVSYPYLWRWRAEDGREHGKGLASLPNADGSRFSPELYPTRYPEVSGAPPR